MSIASDLRTLWHLAFKPVRGHDHAARLESFYQGQAESYDGFRQRLLQGRAALYQLLDVPLGGMWVEMGGGTGANLESLGPRLDSLGQVEIVDLSPSLLAVADQRIRRNGWTNVRTVEADAIAYRPPQAADVVTCSYSLTMIPDWFAALENAWEMLKPGGLIAVVDFYVARKHPAAGHVRHNGLTRHFWPVWFGMDNVFPSPDHVPYLERHFQTVHFAEGRAKIPYLPLGRTPYYTFIGRKPLHTQQCAGMPGAPADRWTSPRSVHEPLRTDA